MFYKACKVYFQFQRITFLSDQLDSISNTFSLEEELRTLSINDTFISRIDMETIFPSLACNINLTTIDLSSTYVGKNIYYTCFCVLKKKKDL